MQRAAFSHIEIDKIRPGRNVRVALQDIESLADSLRRHGMLQPITVVPREEGDQVEVLFGHRRLAAAHMAGFTEVPCFMRGRGNEQARLCTQLAENFDRDEMTPLEEALAFRDLAHTGLTQIQIGMMVHRSDFYVSTRMSVLRYPECVQRAVHERRVSVATALSIPLDLLAKPQRVNSLAKTLLLCELGKATPIKEWIGAQLTAVNRTPTKEQRRRRYLEVSLETYQLAFDAARAARSPLFDWTAQLIAGATGAE